MEEDNPEKEKLSLLEILSNWRKGYKLVELSNIDEEEGDLNDNEDQKKKKKNRSNNQFNEQDIEVQLGFKGENTQFSLE